MLHSAGDIRRAGENNIVRTIQLVIINVKKGNRVAFGINWCEKDSQFDMQN